MDIQQLAQRCHANSAHWFPTNHLALQSAVTHCTLGLAGEAGEVANKVKKLYGYLSPCCARSPGMQIVEAHQHPTGIVLELCPPGRMSRRWLYLEGVIAVSDVSDPPAATHRNRRGITEQQHIDIGDAMYEREREGRE